MKIIYHKRITDDNELKPFLSQLEPQFSDERNRYIVVMKYNLRSLEKSLLDNINKHLKEKGFTTTPSSDNNLWISKPDKFLLTLDAKITRERDSSSDISYYFDVQNSQMIKRGTKLEKNFFGTKEIPVYFEIPSVNISGQVDYGALEEVEIVPVLDVLTALNYESKVISTNQEYLDALKESGLKKEYLKIHIHNDSYIGSREMLADA